MVLSVNPCRISLTAGFMVVALLLSSFPSRSVDRGSCERNVVQRRVAAELFGLPVRENRAVRNAGRYAFAYSGPTGMGCCVRTSTEKAQATTREAGALVNARLALSAYLGQALHSLPWLFV